MLIQLNVSVVRISVMLHISSVVRPAVHSLQMLEV